jgi:hypothetical protein
LSGLEFPARSRKCYIVETQKGNETLGKAGLRVRDQESGIRNQLTAIIGAGARDSDKIRFATRVKASRNWLTLNKSKG